MMRKFLLASLVSVALAGPVAAQNVKLNWVLPATVTGLQSIQLFDTAALIPGPIGTVGPTVTTFTSTTGLAAGVHTFTAVAVYASGQSPPSNAVVLTVTLTLLPVTNLTGTLVP